LHRYKTGQVDEAEMKERQARAMQDPEIQGILQDPIMRQVLDDFSNHPKVGRAQVEVS
jgi:stress-induced-phosphoprotein 1